MLTEALDNNMPTSSSHRQHKETSEPNMRKAHHSNCLIFDVLRADTLYHGEKLEMLCHGQLVEERVLLEAHPQGATDAEEISRQPLPPVLHSIQRRREIGRWASTLSNTPPSSAYTNRHPELSCSLSFTNASKLASTRSHTFAPA